jgi:hypothetical protein
MSSWASNNQFSPNGDHFQRIYERPLGFIEKAFHWIGSFAGSTDSMQHFGIGYSPSHPVTRDRIERAWIAVKRLHPLLAASVVEDKHSDCVKFVLNEKQLSCVDPKELICRRATSSAHVSELIECYFNGPRLVSADRLSCLTVITREDAPVIDFVLVLAHTISDAMAIIAVVGPFLQMLASGADASFNLERRLAIALPPDQVLPENFTSRSWAVRRWRKATATIILRHQMARLCGGHTLPHRISTTTPMTPALSRTFVTNFSIESTTTIIENCRRRSITFGHASPVLSQLAFSRVLHRLYIAGKISDEEWDYRCKQPTHTGGPLNLRPHLSRQWQSRGGWASVGVCLSSYTVTLPRMPRADATIVDETGAPPFHQLLSTKRFIARAQMVQEQTNRVLNHPLFLEMALQRGPSEDGRSRALLWRQIESGEAPPLSLGDVVPVMSGKPVMFHGGSSVGNVSVLLCSIPQLAHTLGRCMGSFRIDCQ